MIELSFLNRQIDLVADWITKAGKALKHFYNEDKGVFWRNNFQIEKDQGIHPTSTNRSFLAMCQYLRFLHEEDLQNDDSWTEICNILKGVLEKYFSLLPDKVREIRKSRINEINMFTDSHLLVSVSILKNLQKVLKTDLNVAKVTKKTTEIAEENIKYLEEWKGGKIHPDDEVHHFVTLQIIRGLDATEWNWSQHTEVLREITSRIMEDTLRLLAYDFAGISSKYDPAELIFCVALLNRFPTPDVVLLTKRSVHSIVNSQASDGAWPTSRYVSYEGHGILHVSSYEIALTLTQLLIRKIHDKEVEMCETILPALNRVFELVQSNFNMIDDVTGWSNDHTRQSGLIESWATAIVLSFLVNYHDALVLIRQQIISQQYDPTVSSDPQQSLAWPDMMPAFRQADWIDFDQLDFISDPTKSYTLTKQLKKTVVRPIADSWIHRPKVTSLILYGPPGARKTTLVIQLAKTLRWPIIILSTSDFLRNGLEGFETTTAKIFDDLLKLRRIVVLLDECEEFFKIRPKRQKIETRTIGAFITAGMLPRLQKLHDRRWVIFVLTTNSKLKQLDSAVTRLGRFDYVQELEYPSLDAQLRYMEKQMTKLPEMADIAKKALEKYEQDRKRTRKPRCLSFSQLDTLVKSIREAKREPTVDRVASVLEDLVNQKVPPSLAKTSGHAS